MGAKTAPTPSCKSGTLKPPLSISLNYLIWGLSHFAGSKMFYLQRINACTNPQLLPLISGAQIIENKYKGGGEWPWGTWNNYRGLRRCVLSMRLTAWLQDYPNCLTVLNALQYWLNDTFDSLKLLTSRHFFPQDSLDTLTVKSNLHEKLPKKVTDKPDYRDASTSDTSSLSAYSLLWTPSQQVRNTKWAWGHN